MSFRIMIAAWSLCLFLATNAHAGRPNDNVKERCNADQINDRLLLQGRNAWARRCGYIDRDEEEFLNRRDRYAVFSGWNAPTSEHWSCINGQRYLADCHLGCFAAGERLLFGGRQEDIATAGTDGAYTVTSLSERATTKSIDLAESEIAYFTAGAADEDLLAIRAETGEVVRVTGNHPMICADGTIVVASALTTGDLLMGRDGSRKIASVESFRYRGTVWNVAPTSLEVRANTNVAEGFVTGSVRFQNEWAGDDWRLALRDRLIADIVP